MIEATGVTKRHGSKTVSVPTTLGRAWMPKASECCCATSSVLRADSMTTGRLVIAACSSSAAPQRC